MSLFLHISIHILSGLLAGYFVWRLWKKPLPAFLSSFLGAVVIDFDHFIDYFLAFGFNFSASWRINYFIHGYQFLKTDKIYILFHGWEYVIIFLILGLLIFKNKTAKTVFVALALGMLFHLIYDTNANEGMRFRSYSIIYRAENNFNLEKAVTPEHWIDHQSRKGILQTL